MGRTLDVITIGVAILVFGLSLVACLLGIWNLTIWQLIPMFLTIFSLWIIATAGIKAVSKTSPYEMPPFSTAGLGLVLLAVGTAWWMYARGIELPYVVLTLTIIIGVLVVVAGIREWTKGKKSSGS